MDGFVRRAVGRVGVLVAGDSGGEDGDGEGEGGLVDRGGEAGFGEDGADFPGAQGRYRDWGEGRGVFEGVGGREGRGCPGGGGGHGLSGVGFLVVG